VARPGALTSISRTASPTCASRRSRRATRISSDATFHWRPTRDAYLEPWGRDVADTFALALRVGTIAHTFGWARHRDHLPEDARPTFDKSFAIVLRRALARTLE
jgi:hypothetical protein